MKRNRSQAQPRLWQFTLREVMLAIGFVCLGLVIARHRLAEISLAHFVLSAMLLVAALSSTCVLVIGLPFLIVAALAGAIPKTERRDWWTIAAMIVIYTVTFWSALLYT